MTIHFPEYRASDILGIKHAESNDLVCHEFNKRCIMAKHFNVLVKKTSSSSFDVEKPLHGALEPSCFKIKIGKLLSFC